MGKLIGAILGFFVGGPLFVLLGLAVGHFFDRGLVQAMGFNYGAERERIQSVFFDTIFSVLGHLAKADGRVCESEVAQAEAIISQLGLNAERRAEAIKHFKSGSADDYNLEAQMSAFLAVAKHQALLRRMFLEALFAMALADGEIDSAEQGVLATVARYLGLPQREFERWLNMAKAQRNFHQQSSGFGGSQPSPAHALHDAYKAIGVEETASDAELKKAYRRLMSEHHPDKLIAKGVPEDMIKLATEKSQEIQAAYEMIKKSR